MNLSLSGISSRIIHTIALNIITTSNNIPQQQKLLFQTNAPPVALACHSSLRYPFQNATQTTHASLSCQPHFQVEIQSWTNSNLKCRKIDVKKHNISNHFHEKHEENVRYDNLISKFCRQKKRFFQEMFITLIETSFGNLDGWRKKSIYEQ